MFTDWILIGRLAAEIDNRFREARVRDVGQLEDGRFALALWKRGTTELLCADVFAATPLITVENGELPIATEPGFVRAAGAALRGKVLQRATAVERERILRFDFAAASQFGVPESARLVVELVPRFGNIILLKGETVIAALKEFARMRRGEPYQPPPVRAKPFQLAPDAESTCDSMSDSELYVYRDDRGELVQVYVTPLEKYAGLAAARATSLLDVLNEARRPEQTRSGSCDSLSKIRADAERALAARERKLQNELQLIEAQSGQYQKRESLRQEGDAIYAHLHELPPRDRAGAKAKAAALFARYKKAAAAATHLTRRRSALTQALADLQVLRWELGRAELDGVREIRRMLSPKKTEPKPAPRGARKPVQFTTTEGSRILLGRSPLENAELTFRIARPNDLWFHVRGQPGAHVILQRDDRSAPGAQDIERAAQTAAFHSKAKGSAKVTVDYVQRKHVRKRPNAAPGLVTYTEARSIVVDPRDSMNIASPNEKKR